MGLFSRKTAAPIAGRAIARSGTFSQGDVPDEQRNQNNLAASAHVRLPALLELESVADGGVVTPGVQRISWPVANWVRYLVMGLDDGSGRYDDAPDPASIRIPVHVDPVSRLITGVDNELIEAELAPWREAASEQWARTEGVLAGFHQLGELGDFARNEAPKIAQEWADAAAELREELARPAERPTIPDSPIAPEEVARRLAEADAMRPMMTGFVLTMTRQTSLPQWRRQAESVRDGLMPGYAFDLDVECQFRSGVITAEELAELRGVAGTPGLA